MARGVDLSLRSISWRLCGGRRCGRHVRGAGVRILHPRSQWIGTSLQRSNRDVWAARRDLGRFTQKIFGRAIRGCLVHRRCLLVHGINFLRQSCRDTGAGVHEHLRGDSTAGRPNVLGCSSSGCRHGNAAVPMARAVASRSCTSGWNDASQAVNGPRPYSRRFHAGDTLPTHATGSVVRTAAGSLPLQGRTS